MKMDICESAGLNDQKIENKCQSNEKLLAEFARSAEFQSYRTLYARRSLFDVSFCAPHSGTGRALNLNSNRPLCKSPGQPIVKIGAYWHRGNVVGLMDVCGTQFVNLLTEMICTG